MMLILDPRTGLSVSLASIIRETTHGIDRQAEEVRRGIPRGPDRHAGGHTGGYSGKTADQRSYQLLSENFSRGDVRSGAAFRLVFRTLETPNLTLDIG